MQYEDFDKKIRDAADHHHPTYDEQAWGKMESLLDTHMPQKKEKKRRFLFFWLFFLLLGGVVILIAKPWSSRSTIANQQLSANKTITDTSKQQPTFKKDDEKKDSVSVIDFPTPDNNLFPSANVSPLNVPSRPDGSTNKTGVVRKTAITKNSNSPILISNENKAASSVSEKKNNRGNEIAKSDPENTPTTIENKIHQDLAIPAKKNVAIVSEKNTEAKNNMNANLIPSTMDKQTTTKDSAKKSTELVPQKVAKSEKASLTRSNSFFFSLSAGPDVSAAGGEKLGKIKLLAGVGFGYIFKERLTVRTGFYSGRKIYAASPSQYNPPADFWNYYPYLEKVEANCKVYEIPVSVSYHFKRSTTQNWFVTAGLSSYLMKKEEYNYFYKYSPNAPTINSKWTISDENKHLFSVITLSGGYQRKLSNSVSLLLEPYIKLPLSGVGYGKVKLNSGGVLMTIAVSPFQKNIKEK